MDKFRLAMEIVKQIGLILCEPLADTETQRELERMKAECLTRWDRMTEDCLRSTLDVVCSLEVA